MSPAAPQKCTSLTRRGTACRAWAVRGSDPPRCTAHLGSDAGFRRHPGFYSPALDAEIVAELLAHADDLSLDDEIACARVALRHVLEALTMADALRPAEFSRLAGLAFQGARTIARLLRDKRALSGDAASVIDSAMGQALDELSAEWGVEL